MASANIKTPSMQIPFLPHVSEKARERVRIDLNRVTLADVLETVKVQIRRFNLDLPMNVVTCVVT